MNHFGFVRLFTTKNKEIKNNRNGLLSQLQLFLKNLGQLDYGQPKL